MIVDIGPGEAHDVGINAYIYLYPLVTMERTRRQAINIEPGHRPGFRPMNAFSHIRVPRVGFERAAAVLRHALLLRLYQPPVVAPPGPIPMAVRPSCSDVDM